LAELNRTKSEINRKSDFIDKLTGELNLINEAIDDINVNLEDDIDFTGDIADYIHLLDSLLIVNKERIVRLKEQLTEQASGSAESDLVSNLTASLEAALAKKEREIISLKQENGMLTDSLTIISQENRELSSEISSLNLLKEELIQSINQLRDERADIVSDLARQKEENSSLRSTVENALTKEAQGYFDTASDLMAKYDAIKGPFRKKAKKEYIALAYENFKKACEAGHPEAKDRLRILFMNKEYYKNLDLDPSFAIESLQDCSN
jgi:chromosome segregation ATPase